MIDTLRLTAEDAAGLLEHGDVSGEELAASYVEAIEARDPELHAYLHVVGEAGEGVPIAHKDVITTKGIPTTAGSRILVGYTPVFDSTVAARCKAAGLPILGKTNLDEFAMGSSTENSAFGPSRNPGTRSAFRVARRAAQRQRSRAGSRRGRSVPTREAPSSSPPRSAASSGCARPTERVSRYGIVAFASSLDQVGPLTKTVRDGARLYAVIAGKDPCDSTTVELPEPVAIPRRGLAGACGSACPRR